MSGTSQHPASASIAARVRGLRANSFSAVVMLLLEYGLGMWLNLYTDVPESDHRKGLLATFASSVTHGAAVLAIHALLGTLLLVTAIIAVARAMRARRPVLIAIAAIGLVAVLAAWLSGTSFVSQDSNRSSLSMAIAAAVAILSYVTILFVTPSRK
jgi:hypothetical protein